MSLRRRTALVTGVSGQDGVYLARSLAADGCRVVGVASPGSGSLAARRVYLADVEIVELDVRDTVALADLVAQVQPDEVYNLAAMSSVGRSWSEPELTVAVNQTAVEVLVAALLDLRGRTGREVRLLQASSAEVSGAAAASPYARSKAAAEQAVLEARDRSGLHACIARLYIHESPLRASTFVSRKITRTVAEIATGRADRLVLGSTDVVRDWGFAGDYVEAIRRLLARSEPADLPLGSGRPHALRDLVDLAFDAAGLGDATPYLEQDPGLVRPADSPVLVADPEPARRLLGWEATVDLETVVAHMVRTDVERLRTGVEESLGYLHPAAPDLAAR